MKSLQDIRREYARQPIEKADPATIESKMPPDREDFYAATPTCAAEGCQRDVFRGGPLCVRHHLEKCEEREKEVERLQKEDYKRRGRKDWPEEEAKARVLTQTLCSHCGDYPIPYAKRTVQLKPKNRRPKHPQMIDRLYEMLCSDCVKAGR